MFVASLVLQSGSLYIYIKIWTKSTVFFSYRMQAAARCLCQTLLFLPKGSELDDKALHNLRKRPTFFVSTFPPCLSRACLGKHDCLHEAMKKNRGSSFRTSKAFQHPAGVVHLERSTAQKGAARCLHSAPLALPGRPRHDRHAIDGH